MTSRTPRQFPSRPALVIVMSLLTMSLLGSCRSDPSDQAAREMEDAARLPAHPPAHDAPSREPHN